MKRLALFLILAAPLAACAGPIDWAKRQVRDHPVRTRIVATVVSGTVYGIGLRICRRTNVENCQEKYGAALGGYISTMALDGVAQLVGYEIGGETGDSISYGSNLGIIGFGAYQWHGGLNKPSEDENETSNRSKPDLSRVVVLRH